jgi:hypothetical protein
MFALSDLFHHLTAVKIQLLARALKNGHEFAGLPKPEKRENPKTGFKCNYYDERFTRQIKHLHTKMIEAMYETKRDYLWEQEKYELINNEFLKPLGYDAEGSLL